METLTLMALGTVVLSMAFVVVCAKSPLRSALSLIVVQCALAGVYVLAEAPFVAAMQVLVYAGAIMVLFLFVIMLLNLGNDPLPTQGYLPIVKWLGAGSVVCVISTLMVRAMAHPLPIHAGSLDGSVAHVGALLLGPYLFAFEAVSVLLLAAVVGSIVLNLKRLT